jgi:hypothetical protein
VRRSALRCPQLGRPAIGGRRRLAGGRGQAGLYAQRLAEQSQRTVSNEEETGPNDLLTVTAHESMLIEVLPFRPDLPPCLIDCCHSEQLQQPEYHLLLMLSKESRPQIFFEPRFPSLSGSVAGIAAPARQNPAVCA